MSELDTELTKKMLEDIGNVALDYLNKGMPEEQVVFTLKFVTGLIESA